LNDQDKQKQVKLSDSRKINSDKIIKIYNTNDPAMDETISRIYLLAPNLKEKKFRK